jgi:hypothetical protein
MKEWKIQEKILRCLEEKEFSRVIFDKEAGKED